MEAFWKPLIASYRSDEESVYNTWFINNGDRLKAFRSVRQGVRQVVEDIKAGRFGNDFKGSSLEVVLSCITEQKQVFDGAAHPFYWKPKLRIPDIYENQENKIAFGSFLENCLRASREDQILHEIIQLDRLGIKGLGPAVASILYFLHPTLIPPFNTGILNGYNALFGEKRKLGSWSEYLHVREALLSRNQSLREFLSNDLGAISGLLFDIGIRKISIDHSVPLADEEKEKYRTSLAKRHREVIEEREEENQHSEMQYHLLRIGRALGYDVISAANDRSRAYQGNLFSFLSLPDFPDVQADGDVLGTIQLVDILWFEKGGSRIVCAFEVEKSTSIYSGILRLSDLTLSMPGHEHALYLVVPDRREREVLLQLARPAMLKNSVDIRYILFSDLRNHCNALCRFGETHGIMAKIARRPIRADSA